jgi:hypothetical protein
MKKNFLKLGLLLTMSIAVVTFTSCNRDEPTIDNSVINARNVIALTGSTDEIVSVRKLLCVSSPLPLPYSLRGGFCEILAQTSFQNNGFTLRLPATVSDNYLYPINGFIPVTSGNLDAKWSFFNSRVPFALNEDGNEIGFFNLLGNLDAENSTGTLANWIYVNSDAIVTYEIYEITVNLNLKKAGISYIPLRQ